MHIDLYVYVCAFLSRFIKYATNFICIQQHTVQLLLTIKEGILLMVQTSSHKETNRRQWSKESEKG